ncbi:MAG: SIMPL domain-containing protein [Alcaligenaceae bacterium]|nr:SIMPL domain-containing protein [Alcaligenaceae bacterium]
MKLLRRTVFLPLLLSSTLVFAQSAEDTQRFFRPEPESFVRVGAEAYREVREDRANVTLSKELDGEDQRQLMRDINLAMRNVVELGKDNPELELETGNYSLRKNIQYKKDTTKIEKITYTAIGQVIVRSKNFDELLAFVEAAHEDMLVGNIHFDLSTDLRRSVEEEILEEAIEAFRVKAETIATGLGYERFEVRNIEVSDSESSSPIRPLRSMTMSLDTASVKAPTPSAAPPLEGGKQMVRVSVSGQIILK